MKGISAVVPVKSAYRSRVLLALFLALLAGSLLHAVPAAAFTDVSDETPYRAAIEAMGEMGIVNGYTDGSFRPGDSATRAQFVKMLVLSLGLPVSEEDRAIFLDVPLGGPDTLYPDNYIAAAHSRGLIRGTEDNYFRPSGEVLLCQAVTMMVRAFERVHPGVLDTPPESFGSAWGDFSPAHQDAARTAEYNGLLSGLRSRTGTGDLSSLNPWAPALRGELAEILFSLVSHLPEEPGEDPSNEPGENPDDPVFDHVVSLDERCADCHLADLAQEHEKASSTTAALGCNGCHQAFEEMAVPEGCMDCHSLWGVAPAPHTSGFSNTHLSSDQGCSEEGCHSAYVSKAHAGVGCGICHSPTVVPASATCTNCHADQIHYLPHAAPAGESCAECHEANLIDEHLTEGSLTCAACHESTVDAVRSAIVAEDTSCTSCHIGASAGHRDEHELNNPVPETCPLCHQTNLVDVHLVGGSSTCATCHGAEAPAAIQTVVASYTGDNLLNPVCTECHATGTHHAGAAARHGADYAGVYGGGCAACHLSDLPAEHERSSSASAADGCAACHPLQEPFAWTKSCEDCHGSDEAPPRHAGLPQLHQSTQTDCLGSDCHWADIPTTHHGNCAYCHDTSSVPTTTDCHDCHTMSSDYWTVDGEFHPCENRCHDF